jgi:hypothetical protein
MNLLNLTQTSMTQFRAFMKFVADNNLWDEAEARLNELGYKEIIVSAEPINVIRQLPQEKVATEHFQEAHAKLGAKAIIECGCGVSNPGPPAPVFLLREGVAAMVASSRSS